MGCQDRDTSIVDQLLGELELVDPPPGLVREVMARIDRITVSESRGNSTLGSAWGSGRSALRAGASLCGSARQAFRYGGNEMIRSILLGVAAGAAVVIATFAMTGWPPVEGGIEGDITQAKRYQAQQLSSKDVVLEDTEAHRFIQSDTFDRLLKDPDARRLLNNPDIRVRLSDAAVSDPTFKNLLGDPAVGRALATPVFQAAVASPGFRAALLDLHFAFAMATGLRAPSGCDDFGCGTNSPIVDGAAIATTSVRKE
jgi:hypothetical protein